MRRLVPDIGNQTALSVLTRLNRDVHMNDEPNQTAALLAEQLRDAVTELAQSVNTLLESQASVATLETALESHDILRDQLTTFSQDDSAIAALERIELFITHQAGDHYRLVHEEFDEQQHNHFMALFARQLLALDGVGPATARQLYEQGVYTPDQFFALTPKELSQLSLPPASLARLIPLHAHPPHADT